MMLMCLMQPWCSSLVFYGLNLVVVAIMVTLVCSMQVLRVQHINYVLCMGGTGVDRNY